MTFKYDDGHLVYTDRRGKMVSGSEAGTLAHNGYVVVIVNGKITPAHRIIWELHNGGIPDGKEIDHINGDKSDNRIGNLRVVTRSENLLNRKLARDNTSGFIGVSFDKIRNKWQAKVQFDGKLIFFGRFSCPTAAALGRERFIEEHKMECIKRNFNYAKPNPYSLDKT